jgi:hypothetical protein
MKTIFVQYLKTKNSKKVKLHNAELNMAKRPQVG